MVRRRFTLIELLTVIAIIGILIAILFPTLSAARQKAKESTARNEVEQLKTAIVEYQSNYGVLPAVGSVGTGDTHVSSYSDFIKLLQNQGTPGNANPRDMQFLGVKNTPGVYKDPWGNDYEVVVDNGTDDGYDKKIAASLVPDSDPVYSKVAAWSNGHDGNQGTDDDVTSWD